MTLMKSFLFLCLYCWHRHILLVFLLTITGVLAYIPALPTNSTQAVANEFNASGISNLDLKWYPNGSYGIGVAYELAGKDSSGTSQGAFVHFSEVNLTNEFTTTPWIALVSCDANSTNASQTYDIFTLARDRGAVAAVSMDLSLNLYIYIYIFSGIIFFVFLGLYYRPCIRGSCSF